jgi:glycosyltransferase involved in cell wall biosynthesis
MSWVVMQKLLHSLRHRIRQLGLVKRYTNTLLRKYPGLAFQIEQAYYSFLLRRLARGPIPPAGGQASFRPGSLIVIGATLGPGGAERQICTTLVGLADRGYRDVHFLYHWPMTSPNDFYLPRVLGAGISCSQVTPIETRIDVLADDDLVTLLRPLGDLGVQVCAYAKELIDRRPEVVHIWLDHMNVVAGLGAVLAGVPWVVLACRSLAPKHFALLQPYMRPIYCLLAQFPNVIFLNNSEAGAADYRNWLGMDVLRIHVIRNGFNMSDVPAEEEIKKIRLDYRRRLGISSDALVVGVVMRISEEKQPFLWMQVAARVAAKMSNVQFLVVGEGPLRERLEGLARESLPGKVHFPGNEKKVLMALAAMDLFLLTSRAEGLPNVLIEAQAMGVPPVAIDVGGVRETILDGDTGWVIHSAQASVVADAVVELLSDRTRLDEASRRGRDHARLQFSQERMVDETLAVYGLKPNGSKSESK